MHSKPFAIAATDQKLLLTFATLYLAPDLQAEVPRVGQVMVRRTNDRRAMVLSPLHWSALRQFEGGRTTASVLKQMINGRSCVPLADFYELVVKAHRHGLLTEKVEAQTTPPIPCVWHLSLRGRTVRYGACICTTATIVSLLLNPPGAPDTWFWWPIAWLVTAVATSAGYDLAASVLNGAGLEVHSPRLVLRSLLPRFQLDLSDVEMAPLDVAINVALAQLIPPLAFTAMAAWFQPALALPLVAGLLFAMAPLGNGPLLKLLRELHYEPRLAVEHDFLFEANRTLPRRLRSRMAAGELRYAAIRVGYAVVWTVLLGLVACIATDTDARGWWADFIALDIPSRLGVLALGAFGIVLAAIAIPVTKRAAARWKRLQDARRARKASTEEMERLAPPTPAEILEFLGKTHPFELMPEFERRRLAHELRPRGFIPGELLAAAGDCHARLHLLYSGRVIVQKGRLHLTLNELHPGSVFAEHALLRGRPEPHDVRATERGMVLELEADAFGRHVTPFLPAHSLEDSSEKVALLRQLPISRHWPQALMASFARRAVIQTFDRGTQVLEEGRENTLFFLVLEGELRAIKDRRPVGRLRRGDIFGEISLLQNSITQADIVGHKPGRFLCVSKPDFLTFLTQDTQVALQIEAIASRRLGHPVFSPPRSPLRRKRG